MKFAFGREYIEINDEEFKKVQYRILLPDAKTLQENTLDSQIKRVEESLENPVDSFKMESWYKKGDKVAIIIPDITRNCSQSVYLEVIVRSLEAMDMDIRKNASIIIATGNHRHNTEAEFKKLLGDYVYNHYRVKNHNPMEDLTFMGTSARGNKIFLDSEAVEADKVLVTGSITYHNFAGISGGRKSILPGIAGKETILYNHRLMVDGDSMHEKSQIGSIEGNPLHEDMLEAVKFLDPEGEKIYAVNVVANMYGQIIASFAGHLPRVFGAGVEFMRGRYQISVEEKADVVISSAGGYPYDINYYQSFKSLYSASKIIKTGGWLFLLADCMDGLGESYDKFKFWFSKNCREVIAELGTNFDMVGQIAYWTRFAGDNYKLYVVTNEKNIECFRSVGLNAIGREEFESRLKLIFREAEKEKVYITPYSNITYLSVKG